MQHRSSAISWLLGWCFAGAWGCSNDSSPPASEPAVLSFRAPIELSGDRAPQGHVLVADANADGWLDVLTWGVETQQVNLANPVERGIARAREAVGLPAITVKQAHWLDLNGDKAADLLVLDADGNLRRFDNQFGEQDDPTKYVEVSLRGLDEQPMHAFVLLDVNRDGTLDVISYGAAEQNDATVRRVDIHLGVDSGFELVKRFVFEPGNTSGEGDDLTSAVLYPSDLDNDGAWEVVIGVPGLGLGVLYADDEFTLGHDAGPEMPVVPSADAGMDGVDASSAEDGGGLDAGVQQEAGVQLQELGSEGMRWEALITDESFDGALSVVDDNGDGQLDLVWFSAGDSPELFMGRGDGTFERKTLGDVKPAPLGCIEDFNNDSRLDVLSSAKALTLSLADEKQAEFQVAVTLEADASGKGIACVDLDADGDVDVLTAGTDGTKLYINELNPQAHEASHFYGFRFRGKNGNLPALGTRVRITAGEQEQTREYVFASHGAATNVPAVHFGLAGAENLDEVRVFWPTGENRTDTDWEGNAQGTLFAP